MTMTMAVQGRALRKEPRGCRGKRSARGPAEAGKQGWSRVRSLCVCPRVSEDEPPSAAGMNPGRGGDQVRGGAGSWLSPLRGMEETGEGGLRLARAALASPWLKAGGFPGAPWPSQPCARSHTTPRSDAPAAAALGLEHPSPRPPGAS